MHEITLHNTMTRKRNCIPRVKLHTWNYNDKKKHTHTLQRPFQEEKKPDKEKKGTKKKSNRRSKTVRNGSNEPLRYSTVKKKIHILYSFIQRACSRPADFSLSFWWQGVAERGKSAFAISTSYENENENEKEKRKKNYDSLSTDILQSQSSNPTSVTPNETRQLNSTRICVHRKRVPGSSSSFSSRCTRSLSSLSSTKRFQNPRKASTSTKTNGSGNVGFVSSSNSTTKNVDRSFYEKAKASTSGMSLEKSRDKEKSSFEAEKKLQSKKIWSKCPCIGEKDFAGISGEIEEQKRDGDGNVARPRKVNHGDEKLSRNHKGFQDAASVRPPTCVRTLVSTKKKFVASVSCPKCLRPSTPASLKKKQSPMEDCGRVRSKIGKMEIESKSKSKSKSNCRTSFRIDACEISKESENDAKAIRKNDRSYKILGKSSADFPACLAIEKAMENSDETRTKKFFIEILHTGAGAGAVVKDCTSLHVAKPSRIGRKEGIVAVSVNCQKIKENQRKSNELLSRKSHYLTSSILDKTFVGKECSLKSLVANQLIKKRKCKRKIENAIAMPLQIAESIHAKRFVKTAKYYDPTQLCPSKSDTRNPEKKRSKSNWKNDGIHRAYEIFLNNCDFNEICLYERYSSKNFRSAELLRGAPKRSLVCQRVIGHHEKMKESLSYKPLRRSCGMYLTYKQPVSKSIFKNGKFANSSINSPFKDVSALVSQDNYKDREFVDAADQRQILKKHLTSTWKCNESKIPPYTSTLSPRRSLHRTIKASKQPRDDVYDSLVSKKEADKSFLFEEEAATSKGKAINRKYLLLDLASYRKKLSEKFHDLYDFYTTLESMNELRSMSTSDLQSVCKIAKRKQLREKLEEELDSLYTKLKSFQKNQNFLFATKDVDKMRWKGDCSLRCKRQSVENTLQYFQGLERENKPSKGHAAAATEVRFDKKDPTRKSLRRGHSMYDITYDDTKNLDMSHSRRHGEQKKCWRSLSVEQVAALKSQLETIYGNKRFTEQRKSKEKSQGESQMPEKKLPAKEDVTVDDKIELDTWSFEVVVPSQFGEDLRDSQKNLYVRCHSATSSDDLKKSMTSVDPKSDTKSSLKKSDSISYGGGEKTVKIELENIPCPPAIYGSDGKGLNLPRIDLSLPSTSRGIVDRHSVKVSDAGQRIVAEDPSKDFYSLQVFYDEGFPSKPREQSTLLLGAKRDNEDVQSFRSERPEESPAPPRTSIITPTRDRDLAVNETNNHDLIQKEQAWTKMISLQNSCLDCVPRKIEFFESAAKQLHLEAPKVNVEIEKEEGGKIMTRSNKSSHSQSLSNLKDLFGETKVPRYVGVGFPFVDYAASPASMEEISTRRRGSHDVARRIGDVPPKWMYSWPRNDERHRPTATRSSSPTRFKSVSLCACGTNYFKFVNNGTVRRLRDYFECTGNFCSGENRWNFASKRFRSDPELTTSTKDFSVHENLPCPLVRNESTELSTNIIDAFTEFKTSANASANGNKNVVLEIQ